MAINFAGYVFKDNGAAVSGADVYLKQVSDGVTEASTTTDSNGYWAFSESDEDRYYVEIAQGSSKRFIRWADEISLKEIDVRNNEANTTPAATFTNLTNNASNQVAVFSGANTTRADNDEIYMSFKLADSAGNIDEFARMTVVATDVTATEEDAQIEFDVMKSGNLTKVWTITSSTAGAMSFDMNVDSLTIGSGADTDISLTFDANTSDGVITWMEDEDYFQFSDDILMSTTERINLRDTAIYIYSSTDGQLDLVADTEIQIAATTIDINGAVAFDGALTGITNITLSGTLSDGNYTFDTSGNVSGLGTVSSGTITTSGNIELGHASDTTLARSGSGDVTIEGNAIYRAGGTDVPVADGGTGASSLTDGGVLLGSGTSAVTAMAVLADSEMIVGDGTTDPVAESGATLRTSIGVGTGDSPQFTDLTLTDDLILNSDSAVISLGDGNDATLTHDGTTGLTIGGNPIIVDSGGQIELDSASGILTFEDGGTEVLRFTEGNSGDVTIKLVTNGKDLIFTDNGDATNMKILDAAAGINVPGEVQTTGIGYTDGDNAMTIADGGAVTFPVSIDVTGSAGIILENDETITNSTNGYVALSGSLTIPNAGTIGSAGDADSIAIASDGVVTMNQIPVFSAGINVSGGTIAGTIATATQNSITTMTGLVTTGTIGTGVWQGTAIDSAYLDADTAHLSTTQTFTGAKTFTNTVTVGANTDGYDVKFFGDGASKFWMWDESANKTHQRGQLIVGEDGEGHDVQFFGDTANAQMLWDGSVDDLLLKGAARLGIGTTNTTYGVLSIDDGGEGTRMVRLGGTTTTSGNLAYISRNLASGSTDSPVVRIRQDNSSDDQIALLLDQDGSGNILTLRDGGTEVFNVLDGGTVVIGHTAAVLPAGATPVYNQIGTTQNTASWGITRYSANTGAPQIFIAKSRNGTIGDNSFPLNNDGAGSIHWQSADATDDDLAIESAVIRVDHKANAAQNVSTTDMAFWTANGATAAVGFTIHANKNATLVGTLTESSDVALKTNINTIDSALNKVNQMRGVSYDRTDINVSGVGLVAQELEEIAPELVSQGTNDSEEYKSVSYTKLTAYLVEAIKELSNKVKDLEAK